MSRTVFKLQGGASYLSLVHALTGPFFTHINLENDIQGLRFTLIVETYMSETIYRMA